MSDLARAYFAKDPAALRAAGAGEPLVTIATLHWAGKLPEAHAEAERACAHADTPDRALVDAERALLSVKIGRGLVLPSAPLESRDRVAELVWWYASFTYYFWVDHRRARAALRRMLLLSVRMPSAGMVATTLFLMGHLLAIRGWSGAGYAACRALVRFWIEPRRGPFRPTAFAESIVFAAFPYTALVANQIGALDEITRRCQRRLPADPYYVTIFLVSALYAAAYTGDVVKAEIHSAHLRALHEKGAMLRYRPIARLMPLLPLALRGYTSLVEGEFASTVASHVRRESDAIINSQFFRAAALIALSTRQYERAYLYVSRAIRYRRVSRSFHAWADIDAMIRDMAARRVPFEPSDVRLFGLTLRFESPASLGTLLLEAINALPAAFAGGREAFEERVFALLRSHVDCPDAEVRTQPALLAEHVPQIRVGSRYLVLRGLDPERAQVVDQFLATIGPVFGIMAASIDEILALKADNERVSRQAALAKMMQMLAHDVRRPFSLLQIGVESIRAAGTPDEVRRTADAILPEIAKANAVVNGLIADVMEIGNDTAPRTEPVAAEEILEASLFEAFRLTPTADVALEYRFAHDHDVCVDPLKVQRVVTNIVVNALQAMGRAGHMRFATAEVIEGPRRFVEIAIGNDGPPIPKEELPRIFDAFYTRTKRDGTGLGLAIAHRIVTAHGGRIACASSEDGVEFRFTLPAHARAASHDAARLPAHSRDALRAAFQGLAARGDDEAPRSLTSAGLGELESGVDAAMRALGRPLEVLVVDDEREYADALELLVERSVSREGGVRVTTCRSGADMRAYLAGAKTHADLAIVDVDLHDAEDGIAWVGTLRRGGMPGVVCVHTNASSPEVFRAALRRGADSVLPKPMSRAHLLKLLRLAFDHATEAGREVEGDTLPEIALVDDSRAFLLGWRATLKGKARLHFFTSPQAFWAAADRDATLLARLAVLVTDYRFSSSSHDGATFALALRARRADLRILLASSGAFTEREVAGTFDAVLDKHALDWAAIAPHVRAGRPSGPALPAADEARQTNELA